MIATLPEGTPQAVFPVASTVECSSLLPPVPEATVDVTSVVPFCPPVSLIVNWSDPDRALYRGPEESVYFVVIYSKVGDIEEMAEEMAEAKLEDRVSACVSV